MSRPSFCRRATCVILSRGCDCPVPPPPPMEYTAGEALEIGDLVKLNPKSGKLVKWTWGDTESCIGALPPDTQFNFRTIIVPGQSHG